MRIVDLDLMPYEIEANLDGYTLLKIGTVVDSKSPNFGARKEETVGYYSKAPSSLLHIVHLIARSKIIGENEKISLKKFISELKAETDGLKQLMEKLTGLELK